MAENEMKYFSFLTRTVKNFYPRKKKICLHKSMLHQQDILCLLSIRRWRKRMALSRSFVPSGKRDWLNDQRRLHKLVGIERCLFIYLLRTAHVAYVSSQARG